MPGASGVPATNPRSDADGTRATPPLPNVNANTAAFIEEGRRYVTAEDERSRTFQTGATTLVAAIGVVLSISLAMGDRLHDRDLFLSGSLVDYLYVAGVALLVAAGGAALRAVFPPAVESADYELMSQRVGGAVLSDPLEKTRSELLIELVTELGNGKGKNRKARGWLTGAAFAFALGALVISFIGTTIAVTPKRRVVERSDTWSLRTKSGNGRRIVLYRTSTVRAFR
jgi:hypothetical protein